MIGGGNNLNTNATCATSTTADPMIGPLANNGGPTLTHALLPGSPAIGTANDAVATAPPVNAVDQRGVTRPQGLGSDIGAYEVGALSTSTSVATSGTPSVFGNPVTFTATVTSSGATGSVSFYDGATLLGSAPLSGTTATFTTSALSVGAHSITAVYTGAANYAPSTSAAITQTVNQAPTATSVATSGTPSVYGTAVTFTATVTPGATGTVTFYDGATSLGTGILSGNTATLTTSALTAGSHSITAVYEGDTNYISSTSPAITQTVDPASGGVTLSSSLNPSTYGDAVTFTATVATDATGSITFMDGATTLGSGTIVSGSATFTTSSLGGGSHPITAVYAGDTNHSAATSPSLTQVVNRATTTTTLTTSGGPYAAGEPVTFTATVPAGATGTVTFRDGATVLGTATVVDGTATFTTSALGEGPHSITASYSGDANFAPSESAADAIVIAAGPAVPTLSTWMLMALASLLVAAAAMKVGR